MEQQEIYTREELAGVAGIPEEKVSELEKSGLFAPSGLTAGDVAFYKEEKLQEIAKILQLLEMGYEIADVRKIVQRIGVPGARGGAKTKGLYLTVGELAEKSGVGVRTIKHWEEKGILAPDTRSEGGFRLYQNNNVVIVQLIRDLQVLGFKLEGIKEITDMFRSFNNIKEGTSGLEETEVLEQLDGIMGKVKDLKSHVDQLKEGIRRWEKILDERRRDVSRLKERVRRASRGQQRKACRVQRPERPSRGFGPEPAVADGPDPAGGGEFEEEGS